MAKPHEIKRSWYIIDAAGKPLGRVATLAATLLRGKHKPTYTVLKRIGVDAPDQQGGTGEKYEISQRQKTTVNQLC